MRQTSYKPPRKLKISLIRDASGETNPVEKLVSSIFSYASAEEEPVPLTGEQKRFYGDNCWAYRGRIFRIEGGNFVSEEELKLRIKHEVVKHSAEVQRLRREVEAFENFDKVSSARRERIPASVRMFVWQRDDGRCVECGAKENLEFDHIIPVAEGGATTERNIQLLCEPCNRRKGRRV
jgi:hypothetical protein